MLVCKLPMHCRLQHKAKKKKSSKSEWQSIHSKCGNDSSFRKKQKQKTNILKNKQTWSFMRKYWLKFGSKFLKSQPRFGHIVHQIRHLDSVTDRYKVTISLKLICSVCQDCILTFIWNSNLQTYMCFSIRTVWIHSKGRY